MINADRVDTLATALLDTLLAQAPDTTANEMFSAVLTLANRMVAVLVRLGADPAEIRAGLNEIAKQLPIVTKTIH